MIRGLFYPWSSTRRSSLKFSWPLFRRIVVKDLPGCTFLLHHIWPPYCFHKITAGIQMRLENHRFWQQFQSNWRDLHVWLVRFRQFESTKLLLPRPSHCRFHAACTWITLFLLTKKKDYSAKMKLNCQTLMDWLRHRQLRWVELIVENFLNRCPVDVSYSFGRNLWAILINIICVSPALKEMIPIYGYQHKRKKRKAFPRLKVDFNKC